jgi:methylated-DNA-[protein]-cysteine S-methyltransferase
MPEPRTTPSTGLVCRTIDSPIGPLFLAGDGTTLHRLWMVDQRHAPTLHADLSHDAHAFGEAVDQLDAYFAGQRTEFDLPLHLAGTAFQRRVWDALRTIPYGQTRTYGEIAAAAGQPGAARAVGLANGRNPIAVVVPCHRVIGAGGRLVGYGGGLDRKRALLDLERRHATPTLPFDAAAEGLTGRAER